MRWLALAVLLAAPASARADVVFTQPCPFGAREQTSHAGPRCTPWTCTSDADCEGALVCRPWRVCVQPHDVPPAGRGAFRDPPPTPTREQQVVGSCAPDASCTGAESPRPPTRGDAVGEVSCAVAPHCVRPEMPPIPMIGERPSDAPPQEAQSPPGRRTGNGSACGCRVGPSSSGSLFALGAIAALLAWRRSR